MAGVQLEAKALGNEMTNQQSEKSTFPNITQSWIAVGKLEGTYNFAASLLFALHNLYLRTFYNVVYGCPKVVILVQPRLL